MRTGRVAFLSYAPTGQKCFCSRGVTAWHIYSHMCNCPSVYIYIFTEANSKTPGSTTRAPLQENRNFDLMWDMKTLSHVSPHSWTVRIRTYCRDSQAPHTVGGEGWWSLRGKHSCCGHCCCITACSAGWLITRLIRWPVLLLPTQKPTHQGLANTILSKRLQKINKMCSQTSPCTNTT